MDTRQSQSHKFKEIAKNANFEIKNKQTNKQTKQTNKNKQTNKKHATHILNLVIKMYKHKMDGSQYCGRYRVETILSTDGQTVKV